MTRLESRELPVLGIREEARKGDPSWAGALAALAAVVACALVLRRVLVTGVVMIDDLGYSQAAHDLLAGRFRLQPWPGGQARVGLYGPVALFYALFGSSETTSLLFSLISSVTSVLLAYAIGRLLTDERGGLIGAFLWAVCPIDILAAGALLPDGPMTMLVAAAVWCFLRAEQRDPHRAAFGYLASAGFLAWAVLVKPLALIVLPVGAIYLLTARKVAPRRLASLAALVAGGLAIYAYYYVVGAASAVASGQQLPSFWARFASTATDWTRRLLSEPACAASVPLMVVSLAALLARPEGQAWIAVLWAACTFLIFEYGSVSFREYAPISATLRIGQILPVLLPLTVVSGLHLGRTASKSAVRGVVVVVSAIVMVAAFVLQKTGPRLSWAVVGGTPDQFPLATAAAIALGVATVAAVASPFFIARDRPPARAAALGILLAAIGVASLHAAQVVVLGYQEAWHENLPAVARFLRNQPEKVIYLQNEVIAARLNVASKFALGFDYFAPADTVGRLRVAPVDLGKVGDGSLIVIDDEMIGWSRAGGLGEPPVYFRTPPTNWALAFSAGTIPGHRTRVYRFSLAGAERELLADASRAAAASPGVETLSRLVGAAAAARDYCAAAAAWERLSTVNPSAAEPFNAVGLLRECYEQDPRAFGPNLLQNADFSAGTSAWTIGPGSNADRSIEAGPGTDARALHITFRGGDWAVMTQSATLQPGSAYVYAMRVRSTAPVVALYWQADDGHPFAQNQVYRDWTTLVSAFVAPASARGGIAAWFSPVLMMAPGEAWVSDVRLVRFTRD